MRRDSVQLSAERFGEIDVDLVVGYQDVSEAAPLDTIEGSPVFGTLDAVRTGRYRRLGQDDTAALLAPSALSRSTGLTALDRILRM